MESQAEKEEGKQLEELEKKIRTIRRQLGGIKCTGSGIIVLAIGLVVRPQSQVAFRSLFGLAVACALVAGIFLWHYR